MPLPLFILAGAAVASALGIGAGVKGGMKYKEANDTAENAQKRHNHNIEKYNKQEKSTITTMDNLGKKELEVLGSFEKFQELFEKIKNKPDFEKILTTKEKITNPDFTIEKLKEVSIGASLLLTGLGGAAAGTAGGFAAAGATTAAVMALGTASTGTAIASLSGVAATNATLAALGGGALAAGGGGMALGATVLSGITLGVGLLVGGIIFNIVGNSMSEKADEAYNQMLIAEKKINKVCSYLEELNSYATKFFTSFTRISEKYFENLNLLTVLIENFKKTDYELYNLEEKKCLENTVYLVSILYSMCKVKLVVQSNIKDEPNKVNKDEIDKAVFETDLYRF
ncbi:hypothetical protein RN96_02835 [Fusobacterium polymorphum]|uniref:Glycine zipper family protein n=1 Tax=Fusobacterium nucleatum subsp. polymorphum TaxID=76857 RepID=A0A2B7YMP2_FUSNP|nr:hypothetical protein [Fusobacterium polymorphum]PGH22128.1 hypothetical protein RN96_02835 [Fusobacterium polymorphum]